MQKYTEKRIHLKDNLFLIIAAYKPNFEKGVIVESAQIAKIDNKEHNGVKYEVKTTIHGGIDSSIHYAKVPCARVTDKALQTVLSGVLTYEAALINKAQTRLAAISL